MAFFDELLSDVLAAPFTLTAELVNQTIKTVESVPTIVESTAQKVEDAFDKIGRT
jgi:hypothetical protein